MGGWNRLPVIVKAGFISVIFTYLYLSDRAYGITNNSRKGMYRPREIKK